eukprot:GHVT01067342.1.p1 GENE.GHVT01067342.1~~GHVT01067342.1.p1  ORF type:complete len:244 (-),score=59.11 GHVT01067342.1:293-1024(-)
MARGEVASDKEEVKREVGPCNGGGEEEGLREGAEKGDQAKAETYTREGSDGIKAMDRHPYTVKEDTHTSTSTHRLSVDGAPKRGDGGRRKKPEKNEKKEGDEMILKPNSEFSSDDDADEASREHLMMEMHKQEEQLQDPKFLKERGNELWKQGHVDAAQHMWKRGLSMVFKEHCRGLVDAEAVDLEVALRLNLCASHFNRDEFTRCLDQLEHVLLKKPNHSKALYKQAQVKLKLQVRPLMLQP